MKKIVLFQKSINDEIPYNYKDSLKKFIYNCIKDGNLEIYSKLSTYYNKNNVQPFDFSDIYVDYIDNTNGFMETTETVRMIFSSPYPEVFKAFCTGALKKRFIVNNKSLMVTNLFDSSETYEIY